MELKEFVSETLTQICEGVKDAQERCNPLGARINPPIDRDKVIHTSSLQYRKYTDVKFNIALRSDDRESGKSGIGVLLANISVGTVKETAQDASSVTSVEFSVPVALPFSPTDK